MEEEPAGENGSGTRADAPSAHPDTYSRIFSERLAISPAVRELMERRIERKFGFRWDEFAVLPHVSSLSPPLLVFHDREDTDVPWSDGESIARAWPGGQLVTTQGLGHRRIVHDPQVVSQAISFLLEEPALQQPARLEAQGPWASASDVQRAAAP